MVSSSPSGSVHLGALQGGRVGGAAGSSSPRTSSHVTSRLSPPSASAGAQTFPGNQPAQRVEHEVAGVGFARRPGCAEGVRASAKWAAMQLCDALPAEPEQRFGAAAAEVIPKERGVVVPDFFPADIAQVPRSLRMLRFISGHAEERYRSWHNLVTLWESARLPAVRCGGWCSCSLSGVAVCQCVWLVAGLRWLVLNEEVVIHTVPLGGLLCFWCVQLDALLQLCICSLDGGELHETYCGLGFWGVVGDYPVELERYRPPEHHLLDFRLPHHAPGFICRRRGRSPSGVLCNGVLRFPRGQVVASLSQRAVFEVFPRLWLLQMAGAYGVIWGHVYTSWVIPACQPFQEGQLFK